MGKEGRRKSKRGTDVGGTYRRSGGTGGALSGGAKNPLAVIPIASTPDPVPFLVVPLPTEMLPFLLPGPPPTVPFSILIIDLAFPYVPCRFPPTLVFTVPDVVCKDRFDPLASVVLCRGL